MSHILNPISKKSVFYRTAAQETKTVPIPVDNRIKLIVSYISNLAPIENLLDIGCGISGLFRVIKETCPVKNYYACDILADLSDDLRKLGIIYEPCDLDESVPFSDVSFDVILCSEVIEHLFAPDNIFKFAADTLKRDGFLIVTTPNLAVWYNRLLLLLGYQPSFSEVSIRYNVGKLYTTNRNDVGGHLRMFTLPALVELGKAYGLKTVYKSSLGGGPHLVGIITHLLSLFPSLGSNLFCVMKRV